MKTWTRPGLASALALALMGCGTTSVKVLENGTEAADILRSGAPTTQRVDADSAALYAELRAHNEGITRELPRYEAWSRSAINEINQLFPQLDNPTITMYVYPHLATRDQVPVPGYTTAFRLYDRDQYALPHELPANYPHRAFRRTVGLETPATPSAPLTGYVRDGSTLSGE